MTRIEIPSVPYTISKPVWDDYYSVQESGVMNMMEYPTVVLFMMHDAWRKSYDHFERDGRTDDLTITG